MNINEERDYVSVLAGSTGTECRPKTVWKFIGGATDGSEIEWIEITVKEAAIELIKSQPFYT